MSKKLTPEEIAGMVMYEYIINQGMEQTILDKMHAINKLESVSYVTGDTNNTIEEFYTRGLYLRGNYIGGSFKTYRYTDEENPTLQLNVEEPATLEDLKDYLLYSDYSELLIIAKEVGLIEEMRAVGPKLRLK